MLLQKGVDTTRSLSQKIIIFTDDYSDNSFGRGGADIPFLHPSSSKTELKVPTSHIASNFTCEFIAIKQALSLYISWYSDDSVGGSSYLLRFKICS